MEQWEAKRNTRRHVHICVHKYVYTQDVLECSFYHVLDGLTVENNHFDGRLYYRGYVLALAHCAASPIPEAVAAFYSVVLSAGFRQSLTIHTNGWGRITAVAAPPSLFAHANLIKQLASSTTRTTLTRLSEYVSYANSRFQISCVTEWVS